MAQPPGIEGRQTTPLARKLAWFGELTAADIEIIESFHTTRRIVRRNTNIIS